MQLKAPLTELIRSHKADFGSLGNFLLEDFERGQSFFHRQGRFLSGTLTSGSLGSDQEWLQEEMSKQIWHRSVEKGRRVRGGYKRRYYKYGTAAHRISKVFLKNSKYRKAAGKL